MRNKPDWLNFGDVGYIIDDNHVDGPYIYNVIYPNNDYTGNFCLYSAAMSKKQTMIDILPIWEQEQLMSERGEGTVPFEELYKETYSEINNIFYRTIPFYNDILLYKKIQSISNIKHGFQKIKS